MADKFELAVVEVPKADENKVAAGTALWLGIVSKLSVGTITGYMAGNFTKQITDKAIMMGGCVVLLVGSLHMMQWVTINFKKIDEDLLHLYNRTKQNAKEKGLFEKIKRILIRTVPLLGGFSAGFFYAWKHTE